MHKSDQHARAKKYQMLSYWHVRWCPKAVLIWGEVNLDNDLRMCVYHFWKQCYTPNDIILGPFCFIFSSNIITCGVEKDVFGRIYTRKVITEYMELIATILQLDVDLCITIVICALITNKNIIQSLWIITFIKWLAKLPWWSHKKWFWI